MARIFNFQVGLAILVLRQVLLAHAVTHHVTPAMTSAEVADAFDRAASGDRIQFSSGTFNNACSLTIVQAQLTVAGMHWNQTVLNCSHASRHFQISGSDVLMHDLHLTDGSSSCVPTNVSECGNCQCGQSTADGGNGGCVLVTARKATFRHVLMSQCSTAWNGGAVSASSNSHLFLQHVGVSDSSAGGNGGAIALDAGSNMSLSEDSTIADNTASGDGGGVYTQGGRITVVSGVRMSRNSATNGGAFSAIGGAEVDVADDVTLDENECTSSGGAVMVDDSVLRIFDGVELEGNYGSRAGGAIYARGGNVYICRNVDLTSNSVGSSGNGGALYLTGSAVAEVHENVTLVDNYGGRFGGAWYMDSSSVLTMRDSVVMADNGCIWHGGAGYGASGASVTLESGVEIRNCVARRGGALYVRDAALTARNGVVFDGNGLSSSQGAAIYASRSTVSVTDGVIARNGKCHTGGFIYAFSGEITLSGVDVLDNDASPGWGGAVYVSGSVLRVAQSRILNNVAFHGGALGIKSFASAVITGDVLIAGNIATHNGCGLIRSLRREGVGAVTSGVLCSGAIYSWIQISVTLQGPGVLLDSNHGREWGGAVYVQEDSTLNVLDGATIQNSGGHWRSSWSDPSNSGIGGAIHAVLRARVVLDGARILNNTAMSGGGIDLDNLASVEVSDSLIEGNEALLKGGGINAYEGATVVLRSGARLVRNVAASRGGGVAIANDARVEALRGAVLEGNRVVTGRAMCELPPCGGGGIQVGDVGTVLLSEGTTVRGNEADIGGGLLVMELASASVQGAVLSGNRAVDGGAIAAVNESRVSMGGATCAENAAEMLGGCIFHAGADVEFAGDSRVERNAAREGGGVFMYSRVGMRGFGQTTLRGNRAEEQGGGVALVGSLATMEINASHQLWVDENEAGTHGGGMAVSLGAAMRVAEEACPNDCASSLRGDGVCHPICMSAACNWDEGDCDSVMRASGEYGAQACDRETNVEGASCRAFTQFAECHPSCWNAGCDWHRYNCQLEKARMRECPLYDATVFSSVQQRPDLVYMRGGNAGGYGRCNETCAPPDTVSTSLTWVSGISGGTAVSIGSTSAWIVVHDVDPLERQMGDVTIEAWVNVNAGTEHRGFVVSWEHLSLFVQPYGDSDLGYFFGVESVESVFGSGAWRKCIDRPGEVTTITDAFGAITDGIADYSANMVCKFIIAPDQSEVECGDEFRLELTFHELVTEDGWDFLDVYDCQDIECEEKTAVNGSPFTGNLGPFTIVSSTGILEVSLRPDQVINDKGFFATFDVRPAEEANSSVPGVFAAEEWHHLAVSVTQEGTASFYLDGEHVQNSPVSPLYHTPLGGGFAVGQRFMGPELDRSGRLHGRVDELRVWEGVHDPRSDWRVTCSNQTFAEDPSLVLCFGFDEGAGSAVQNAIAGGAGPGLGVVGDKHLPWCVIKDDGGDRIIAGLSGGIISLGTGWGYCSPDKPRLPGVSFDYSANEMAAVATMTLPQLLVSVGPFQVADVPLRFRSPDSDAPQGAYPFCGGHPLQFTGNKALGGNGGGVYQADCDSAADARGLCFFTGMPAGGGGMTLASFVNNSAAGAGGAAFVECAVLGTSCEKSLQLQLPWPLADATQFKVQLEGNVAESRTATRGTAVAVATGTTPARILLPTDANASQILDEWSAPMQFEYVPGQTFLNLSVALLDGGESLVVSAARVPNTFFVEVQLCAMHGDCSAAAGLAPSVLHRFSRAEGDPVARFIEGEQEVVCAVGEGEVRVKMSLVGAPEVSPRFATVTCLPCEAGQSRQEVRGSSGDDVWTCASCQPSQYVVDPNRHQCQPCPARASCDGSSLWDDVEGSQWRADPDTGIYLLAHCPPGHQLINESDGAFSPTIQQCMRCTPSLQYIVDPNRHECQDCPAGAVCPDGAVLLAGEEGDPRAAAIWEPDLEDGIYKLVSCPPGHQKITELEGVFSPLTQQCKPCLSTQYIVDPDRHQCRDCPAGAICDGSLLQAGAAGDPRAEAEWRADEETGIYHLTSCPLNHQLVNSSAGVFSELAQQCQPCQANLEYVVDPNSGACTPCPIGWPVGCDEFLETLVNEDDGSVWEVDGAELRLIECPSGSILIRDSQFPQLDQCAQCAPDTFSEGRALWYEAGKPLVASRASDAQTKCLSCVEGARCPGGVLGSTETGFWKNSSATPARAAAVRRSLQQRRADDDVKVSSADVGVYPCPPHACVDGECAEGREGVVCGVCKDGYSMAYGTCTECRAGSSVTRPIMGLVLVFLALVALYVGGYIPIFGAEHEEIQVEAKASSKFTAFKEAVTGVFKSNSRSTLPLLGWGKIIISFYQVLSSFISTFPVNWPVQHSNLMENSAVSRFDFMSQPGLNCLAGKYSYKQKIIVYLMSLPTVLTVFLLPTLYVSAIGVMQHGGWNQHPRFQRVIHQFLWMTLAVIFLVYPTVSNVSLRSFNCLDIGEFGRKLVADFREDCPKDHQGGFIFIWSLVFSILYPGGIPVFFFIVLLVYKVPMMARAKIKDALIAALIAQYKRRSAGEVASKLQQQLGIAATPESINTPEQPPVEKFLGEDVNNQGGSQGASGTPLQSPLTGGVGRRNSLQPRRRRLSKTSSIGTNASISEEALMKGLEQATGVSEEHRLKLQRLVKTHSVSPAGGEASGIDGEGFNRMVKQLMDETSQFSGVEKLADLSRDQLKTLIMFDWLRVGDAGGQGAGGGRQRRPSISDGVPFTPGPARNLNDGAEVSSALAYGSAVTPQRKGRSESTVKKVIRRRGSVFKNSTPVEDPEYAQRSAALDALGEDALRNKVKDIADNLREMRFIAIPHLEWDGELGEEEVQAISHIGFLFKNYRVDCWFYELLEIIRKLIVTAVMPFIFSGSPAQVAAGFFVCLLFLILASRLNPYVDHRLERMQIWALFVLSAVLFYGMVLTIQASAPLPLSGPWMRFLNDVFMILSWSVLFYPLLQIYFASSYAPGATLRRQYRKYLKHVEAKRSEDPNSLLVKAHDKGAKLKKAASFRRTSSSEPAAPPRPRPEHLAIQPTNLNSRNLPAPLLDAPDPPHPDPIDGTAPMSVPGSNANGTCAASLAQPAAAPQGTAGKPLSTEDVLGAQPGIPAGYTEFTSPRDANGGASARPQQPEAFQLQITQAHYQLSGSPMEPTVFPQPAFDAPGDSGLVAIGTSPAPRRVGVVPVYSPEDLTSAAHYDRADAPLLPFPGHQAPLQPTLASQAPHGLLVHDHPLYAAPLALPAPTSSPVLAVPAAALVVPADPAASILGGETRPAMAPAADGWPLNLPVQPQVQAEPVAPGQYYPDSILAAHPQLDVPAPTIMFGSA